MILKTRILAVFLLIISAGIGIFVYYSQIHPNASYGKPFKLGLDLNGGTHLVYKADLSKIDPKEANDSMNALRDVIERRVNIFGVSESLVQIERNAFLSSKEVDAKLIVELPGVTDVDEAIKNIGQTPFLEFKTLIIKDAEDLDKRDIPLDQKQAEFIKLLKPTGLTGRMLQKAQLQFNSTTNEPTVSLVFNSEGRELFAKITKENIGNIVAIMLDGTAISLPRVNEEIRDGKAQITGSFKLEEAKLLVRNLNYGALPVKIDLISTQTIGASLGQSAVQGGIRAGILSFIIIGAFLLIWYRLPGLVAIVSLSIYIIICLAVFKIGISPAALMLFGIFFILAVNAHWTFGILGVLSYIGLAYIPGALSPVTMTAAGIAGFILSVGMAVDANILIFERMKEELRRGKSVSDAMHEGFARAWNSIRDSNTSSILTGAILYYFGSTSVVTGFALVFIIGVLVSMFTAITASRLFLFAVAPKNTTRFTRFIVSNGFTRLNNTK